jgi:hypothetical protein
LVRFFLVFGGDDRAGRRELPFLGLGGSELGGLLL